MIQNEPTLIYVLDQNYDAYDVIDTFKSSIWADRYSKCGDFEIYIPASLKSIDSFKKGDYLRCAESEHYMIIEDINLETDVEDGDYLIISGRSLESILARRIIWGRTVASGNLQEIIRNLIEQNIISPAIPERTIPNFTFKDSTDPRITELTLDIQYFGENLYDEIVKICTERNIGFKVLPIYPGGFEFSLYVGEDRSYAQEKNPWVIFSPKYENLLSSNYTSSIRNIKNATLVGGQGEGWEQITETVSLDGAEGLNRRETFTDASSLTNDTTGIENDPDMTEEEKAEAIEILNSKYKEQLAQKGEEALAETKITDSFDGEIDTSLQFRYGEDYHLGDIVQIENDYGMQITTRVSEIVISHDEMGKTVVPTFTVSTDDGKEQII